MNYYYFISTLPMLDFQRPSFEGGVEKFDCMCREAMTDDEFERLMSVSIENPPSSQIFSRIQKQYLLWDTNLRNAVANAAMPDGGALKYLHKEEDYFSETESIVQTAAAKDDPLERDRVIDGCRFDYINGLAASAGFSFEFLAAYRMQLIIIEKYAALSVEQGEANFELLVKEILDANKNNL